MTILSRIFLAAALAASVTGASAQADYPNKPIRLIVPFPPGGGTDILARLVGNKLQENLKWVVVLDNRSGAGGNIGMDLAAKSPADGYTVVMGQTSNLAVNPTLYARLPYNPTKDFAPVTTVATAPLVLVVPANSPFKTLGDVISAAKAKPGEVTFASPGNGTVSHLTGELLQKTAGVKFQHVPYKGSSQAITDLLGGQVQLYMSSVPSAISQIKSGRIRPLAVTSARRSEDLPNVPTINESGYKGFDAVTWFGLLVPAGTPPSIVARLNTEVNKVLKMKDVQEKIRVEGGDVQGSTPEEFAALLKADIVKWGQVVRESGAKID
ncbi:Bug family tripartite tricarboxylate transporter substrate binding protein [Noviherbaspirillum massiliense]|uniref:Bug family tripartite tricarboxylate transporter substrate binding protein n=1 Tax=Noviherbaspirillum massiliense TaxID=1465823 RepID=UPI0003188C7A|nr:tripartite tricarboxylate transporter substrate binding protein [Noviherbaspirillum massiliense]